GSQYAHSPAVVAALPDARLLQQITAVILEAGEKAITPPMVGVQEAIRGDVAVYAGGITWVDAEYDERLGEVLRPMTSDKSG
ncbi:portal protein, partial [Streptococcus pneumoniae]|uniref:portal protein n=1 Tax=Streptococcus pneumoniae TaxID=1313 RepID=UPI00139ADDAC